MQNQEVDRIARHVAAAIESAPESDEPFFHLQPSNVFPPDFYDKMMQSMPVRDDYRVAPSRSKSTRTAGRVDTRVKIDLFPEGIRHLPSAKQEIWGAVGRALCSPQVREAFRKRLASGLERRFGPGYRKVGMYPIPMLTRDGAGHKIGVHRDTHWKGMSTQFYLPKDDSMKHVGTVLHTRTGEKNYERVAQISFSPNTGYAFAVDKHTYHSLDLIGPEVETRDSILLTYFVDRTPIRLFRNRGTRISNFILNEFRNIARRAAS